MKDLKKILGKALAEKKVAKISKGAFLNSSLENYLKKNFNIKEKVNGKLDNNVYIIKSTNSAFSNSLFLNKKRVLSYLNKRLKDMDFGKINDIKII